MEEKGAALYLEDEDVNEDTLTDLISYLIQNPQKLKELQNAALKLAKYDSVDLICDKLVNIAEKYN